MPSAFLANAVVLFAGVAAFVFAGFAGMLFRRLHPFRYRLMLTPLGFVFTGGVAVSAAAHLLRWWNHGASQHTFFAGIFEMAVLLMAGSSGALAGLGLGASLDQHFPEARRQAMAHFRDHLPDAFPASSPPTPDNVVPISDGRRHPGILPTVRAGSRYE